MAARLVQPAIQAAQVLLVRQVRQVTMVQIARFPDPRVPQVLWVVQQVQPAPMVQTARLLVPQALQALLVTMVQTARLQVLLDRAVKDLQVTPDHRVSQVQSETSDQPGRLEGPDLQVHRAP